MIIKLTNNRRSIILRFLRMSCVVFLTLPAFAQFNYPIARKEAFDTIIYGKKITDDYFWMSRESNAEEVQAFCTEQGQLTQSILDSIPGSSMIEEEWIGALSELDNEIWSGTTVGGFLFSCFWSVILAVHTIKLSSNHLLKSNNH